MSALSRAREALRGLFRPEREDAELDEELRFHLEMEAERLEREEGLERHEARRRASIAFGGVEKTREEVRDARGLGWVSGLSLDLKLALRMLRKYPWLALVGGLGMAVAIAVGAGYQMMVAVLDAELPLEEGERVVSVAVLDVGTRESGDATIHDFAGWLDGLESLVDLGAYRDVARNLIIPGGTVEPVGVAEMTASGFRVARVPPLLGRYLVDEDERPGGPAVLVIGEELWRTRFNSDPGVVGREVRLGGEVHTVVGVMPEGFAWPMNHRAWAPLRLDPAEYGPGEGPGLQVFGRLAPGVTLEGAQAELSTAGRRVATAYPETHARIRPLVMSYTDRVFGDAGALEIRLLGLLIILVLALVCANVAVLVYARTAMRLGEITVRSALGASRRRIVAQLFVEALVLTLAAAGAGLLVARFAVGRVQAYLENFTGFPFWVRFELTPLTVAYALGLALVGAVIVGVLPALRATGRRLQSSLRALGAGGGMQMGRTWTFLIVAQVAVASAALPGVFYLTAKALREGTADPGFPAGEYLTARAALDRELPPGADPEAYALERAGRYRDRVIELTRRLSAEPGVAAVTYATTLPGEEPIARIEADGIATSDEYASAHPMWLGAGGRPVHVNGVDPGFFDAFGVRLLAGRKLGSADVGQGATAVVVSEHFVKVVLGGENALGRPVRFTADWVMGSGMSSNTSLGALGLEEGRWYEVVGVVEEFPRSFDPELHPGRVYLPVAAGAADPVSIAVRLRGVEAAAFTPSLRQIAATVDPNLRMPQALPLDEVYDRYQSGQRLGAIALGIVVLSVLLLSAAGIYALMSFSVTRRRREIGIRSALGAHPRRILASVFSRAALQLAVGTGVGMAVAALLDHLASDDLLGRQDAIILPTVAAVVLVVGLLSALGPARRGLRIQPMEALREE